STCGRCNRTSEECRSWRPWRTGSCSKGGGCSSPGSRDGRRGGHCRRPRTPSSPTSATAAATTTAGRQKSRWRSHCAPQGSGAWAQKDNSDAARGEEDMKDEFEATPGKRSPVPRICYSNAGVGTDPHRGDYKRSGFVSAGQGVRWRKGLLGFWPGDVFAAYLK